MKHYLRFMNVNIGEEIMLIIRHVYQHHFYYLIDIVIDMFCNLLKNISNHACFV